MLEYTGIRVRDLDRARRFYTQGLGLRTVASGRVAAGGVRELLEDSESGHKVELNFYPDQPPYREGDELDHLSFRVARLEPVIERLVALGARVRLPPFAEEGERLAFLSDPDGIWIKLAELAGPDLPPTSRSVE